MGKISLRRVFSNHDKVISIFINILLYTIIIVMPFLVVDSQNRKYVDGKAVLLYLCGNLVFITMIFARKLIVKREHIYAFAFLATLGVATLFSNYRSTAFFGNNERIEGFAMIAIYIVLFYASSMFLKINKWAIYAILLAGSLMAIYTVLQMFGIDPIQVHYYGQIVTPTTSIALIGNSNFVSSYLIMFTFVSIGLFIFKKKWIYLLTSTVLFLGFLAARTRGGWLAFVVIAIFGFMIIIKRKDCLIRAGILLMVFVVSFFMLNSISGNKLFDRASLSNIFAVNNVVLAGSTLDENATSDSKNSSDNSQIHLVGSASSRLNILRIAFKAFLDRPLIGEGPDTLGLRLEKNYTNDYNDHILKYNEAIDKSHNEYMEYAVSGGIFTLISYLALTGTIVFKLYKNRKKDEFAIVLLAVLAYLVQAFGNISVIMVAPLFWILLGFALKLVYNEREFCD